MTFKCYYCREPQELKRDDFGLELPAGYVMMKTKNGRVNLTYLLCPTCAAKHKTKKGD